MTVISFQEVHKSFGPEIIFDHFSLNFYAGQKVGLIGPNGSGKTTLFRMILGRELPDIGQVVTAKDLKIGYLPQESIFDGRKTVMEEMHDGMSELLNLHRKIEDFCIKMGVLSGSALESAMKEYDRLCHQFEMDGGYAYEARIKSILAGLDIGPEHYGLRTADLSGGQRSRLGLAKVLVKDTNLLLLDEPTNHLDLQATTWLEGFLKAYTGAVILISHDRYLLDKIAEKIVELRNKRGHVWKGNYSQYLQTRDQLTLNQQREYEKRKEMVERTLDFIARNKDQEGMRKTARGRKTRLERLLKENPDYLDNPAQAKTVHFSFADSDIKSDLAVRAENVSKAYGPIVLFEKLSFDAESGDRIGITGPNGSGKTTLLRLIMGETPPDAGFVRLGPNLKVGYLDQQAMTLNPANTILEEAHSVRPDLATEAVRGRLGAFLFTGDDVFKPVSALSGGQQNRLMLCKLVLAQPDILILDEPTNHLDIPSREMLEEALLDYNGTVVAVSHDRYFLDRIAETLLVVGVDSCGNRCGGAVQTLRTMPDIEGVYSAYARQVEENSRRRELQKAAEKKKTEPPAAPKAKAPAHLRQFNKYSPEQIEEQITETELQIQEMENSFGSAEIYQNPQKLQLLQQDLEKKKHDLAVLYEAWEYRTG